LHAQEAGPATPPQEGKQEAEASPASAPASDAAAASPSTDGVSRLLNLLYFSQVLIMALSIVLAWL